MLDECEMIACMCENKYSTIAIPVVRNLSMYKIPEVPDLRTEEIIEKEKFQEEVHQLRDVPINLDFHDEVLLEGAVATVDNFEEMKPKAEKLMWHCRLGHIPFQIINKMSVEGDLPRRLHKASDPKCPDCIYGQSTRRAWRTKEIVEQVGILLTINQPGDCISMDQMESPVPGLVAHTKGNPTRDRSNCATIFVDHYSDVTFVHLQSTLSGDVTVEAKEAFERWSRGNNVRIKHYHSDNGRFAETKFLAAVAAAGQRSRKNPAATCHGQMACSIGYSAVALSNHQRGKLPK
jgi:hypothetical protein